MIQSVFNLVSGLLWLVCKNANAPFREEAEESVGPLAPKLSKD